MTLTEYGPKPGGPTHPPKVPPPPPPPPPPRNRFLRPRTTVRRSALERFAAKIRVNEATGCWEWTAALYASGYAMFGVRRGDGRGGRGVRAHRWAYEHFVGEVPPGLVLDHTCHTRACPGGDTCPHRRCVNPAHLEPVLQAVNAARGQAGQDHARKTHCLRSHELTEANVYRYGRKRYCRTCLAIRQRARRARLSGLAVAP